MAEHENSPPPYVYCSEEVRKLAALHLRYSLRQIKSFMFSWSRKSFFFLSPSTIHTLQSNHNIQKPAHRAIAIRTWTCPHIVVHGMSLCTCITFHCLSRITCPYTISQVRSVPKKIYSTLIWPTTYYEFAEMVDGSLFAHWLNTR